MIITTAVKGDQYPNWKKIMSHAFGDYVKALRMTTGLTLREFCTKHKIDPGNYSRMERGLMAPPAKEEILARYANALGVKRNSDNWIEFFDLAAAARGELPADLMKDEELLGKLPLLFRTLRGSPVSPDKLDKLVEKIRTT